VLSLPKASLNLRSFLLIGIFLFIFLLGISYDLGIFLFIFLLGINYDFLSSIIVEINNPNFIFLLLAGSGGAFLVLDFYISTMHRRFLNNQPSWSFLKRLVPAEILYSQYGTISPLIDALLSNMMKEDRISVSKNFRFKDRGATEFHSIYELVVHDALRKHRLIKYGELLSVLKGRRVYSSVVVTMEAIQKYFFKSIYFGRIFYANFAVLSMIYMLGVVRLFSGISRDRPVFYIVLFLIIFLISIVGFLKRLTKKMLRETIPAYYRAASVSDYINTEGWDWKYLMMGSAILVPEFIAARKAGNETAGYGDGSSSSCSSCGSDGGSSCGGGCGGCGD